jgi:hypothetical protein
MKAGAITSATEPKELSVAQLALAGTLVVFAAYAIALSIGHGSSFRDAAPGAAANTIPTVLFGLMAYAVIRGWLMKQSFALQAAGPANRRGFHRQHSGC